MYYVQYVPGKHTRQVSELDNRPDLRARRKRLRVSPRAKHP